MPEATVSVVVVTYNRSEMLLDCLAKVLLQDHPVEAVFLIDNASTDDTQDRLRQAGYLDHPLIRYTRMTENTGGAGGFRHGLRLAHEQGGSDWFWVMDDDVAPKPDCLRKLVSYSGISECIHPLVVYEDGTEHEWEHIFVPSTTYQIGLKNRSFKAGKDWCPVNAACFEGMLVSRRVVDAIGYPVSEFFVYGDDGHYGFIASGHTNVIYTNQAILEKKIKPTKKYGPFRIYYDTRNRFMLRKMLTGHYIFNKYNKISFYVYMLLRCFNILHVSPSWENLKACAWAWLDGHKGRMGRLRY